MNNSIDETNRAILERLVDGRESFRVIAEAVGVTENTVRARIQKMRSESVLEIGGRVDPEMVPGVEVVFVGVKLDSMRLSEKAEELSLLPGVVSSCVVTGRFDIMLIVFLTPERDLLEFYKNEMATVEGVASVETFVVYEGRGLSLLWSTILGNGD